MVPADKKMYALRDVTATVDCIPLIAASIMSKKIASGPQNLVLDVKVGRGAFMTELSEAKVLARAMVDIGTAHDRHVQAVLTDMGTSPLGRAVGNSVEIIESAEILQGRGDKTLRDLTLILTADMMVLTGLEKDPETAYATLKSLLDSGRAYEKFLEMVETQGGDPAAVIPPYQLPLEKAFPLLSDRSGYISGIDPLIFGYAGIELGAGRKHQDDVIDPGVGFMIDACVGSHIGKGDRLVSILARGKPDPEWLGNLASAFEFSDQPPPPHDLVLDRVYPADD
jgi:pyrimidine-nucleoside phosphorylase